MVGESIQILSLANFSPFGIKHKDSRLASKNDKESNRLRDIVLMYRQILTTNFESNVFFSYICPKQRYLFKPLTC